MEAKLREQLQAARVTVRQREGELQQVRLFAFQVDRSLPNPAWLCVNFTLSLLHRHGASLAMCVPADLPSSLHSCGAGAAHSLAARALSSNDRCLHSS